MKKNRKLVAGLVIAGGLLLGACSSNGDADDAAPDTTAAAVTETTEAGPVVSIDPDVKAQLDVEPGSAIIPGSIESVAQELNEECTAAVAPIRELMKKYPSLRQVPTDGTWDKAYKEGKKCEAVDAQQWADFYTLELAGWMTAKTDE